MKLSIVICALAASSAAAFAPSANVARSSTSLEMSISDRRAAIGQIGAAALGFAGLPSMASADGAVSSATIGRARGIYGNRIAGLTKAVDAGDFSAVVDEKNAFILFNSGVYAKDKSKQNAAIAGTNKIFAAVRTQDKAALKSAYDEYCSANGIEEYPDTSLEGKDLGQGYSSDYDYRIGTKAGVIYVR
mmetsp:Transcript_29714/g.44068  ORF Transcript_29714/g.44068 Transcript_29714/m.44068 type:complete len:189 (-) Transcript_29714:250-816(-)|eukprot:CAMPEP_0195507810 /NCGR_PEP_ID=MMETSP0794_2-20130614/1182_1 /TAXON_ID=515487 /ORGANISM="Stephanopyxis turris, Strain CCMP 815" /LENGTH=188 /DNA_ID=CAMNT_0040634609 /DNA_START=36 /DNA_END=602 /DNA_ORIENTATION=-